MIRRAILILRMSRRSRPLFPFLAVWAFAAAAPVTTQPSTGGGLAFTVLEPQTAEGLASGKVAGADGTAIADGVHYSVQDLDLMQPVAVALFAVDSAKTVKLEIVKEQWTQVYRSCDTGTAGQCEVRFRTQGNFGIRVLPAGRDPASYQLAVWVGDEIQAVPSAAVAAGQTR